MILLLNGQVASVDTWGDGERVPIFERLFLGGTNDLRGFDFREVGPKDEDDEPIGGRTMARATVELTYPIIEKVRAAVFYDTGFVNRDAYDFSTDDVASDVGFGLRLDLPIGPIRVDYGIPIQKAGTDRQREVQLQRWLSILNEPIPSESINSPIYPVYTYMMKVVSAAVIAAIAFPVASFAQGTLKVGTVDMNRAFKEYNKTKDAESKINDAKNAAKKEYDERAESYKKALDEINKLNQQLEAPALSADAKTAKAKERDEKITSIKNMEREINEFRQTRERQLQEQALRMREGIVKEITDIVMERVKANNLDLVFDKSGMSLNGVPLVMYSRDNAEFTNDVVAALNKGSTAPAAATAAPAAATTPAPTKKP
jgi:Skp family chaperone for outer membrane proteins